MTRLPLAVAAALIVAAPAFAADKKPPACAAVNFRPVGGAMNDGTQTAGHYKSRFGSIDLLADVKGGQATYRTTINNQPLAPFKGDIPKSAYPCLKSKHVATPPQPVGGACTGSRFRVVVDSTGKAKLVMLYALQGDDWKLCEAGTPAK